MIPLALGPGKLDAMSWAWLTGNAVLLVGFIAVVIGIPASVVVIVQLVRPVFHKITRRRADIPAVAPAPSPGLAGLPASASAVIRVFDSDFAVARESFYVTKGPT
jgi:hypothetical protein